MRIEVCYVKSSLRELNVRYWTLERKEKRKKEKEMGNGEGGLEMEWFMRREEDVPLRTSFTHPG